MLAHVRRETQRERPRLQRPILRLISDPHVIAYGPLPFIVLEMLEEVALGCPVVMPAWDLMPPTIIMASPTIPCRRRLTFSLVRPPRRVVESKQAGIMTLSRGRGMLLNTALWTTAPRGIPVVTSVVITAPNGAVIAVGSP